MPPNPYLLLALGVVATSGPSANLSTAWTPDRLWGAGKGKPSWRKLESLHDINYTFWRANNKLQENYDVVSASDHEWCTLTRYNWACVGDAYAAVLNRTRPYRPWRFQLANLPPGTRVFADGNSYLAERMTTLLCGCHSTDVFKLDGNQTNSYLAHSAKNKATFLLFDNDETFQAKSSEPAIELLRGIGFDPDVLLVGVTNGQGHRIKLGRYRAAFPRAALIDFPENAVGVKGCSAEGAGLCSDGQEGRRGAGHQCSPGPLARVAEQDADTILAALWRESRSPRSPRPSRGAPP